MTSRVRGRAELPPVPLSELPVALLEPDSRQRTQKRVTVTKKKQKVLRRSALVSGWLIRTVPAKARSPEQDSQVASVHSMLELSLTDAP